MTLFELLTLELPYTGKTQQLYMSQVLTAEARRARTLNARVSRDLEIVLRKALEKDPKDRYADGRRVRRRPRQRAAPAADRRAAVGRVEARR